MGLYKPDISFGLQFCLPSSFYLSWWLHACELRVLSLRILHMDLLPSLGSGWADLQGAWISGWDPISCPWEKRVWKMNPRSVSWEVKQWNGVKKTQTGHLNGQSTVFLLQLHLSLASTCCQECWLPGSSPWGRCWCGPRKSRVVRSGSDKVLHMGPEVTSSIFRSELLGYRSLTVLSSLTNSSYSYTSLNLTQNTHKKHSCFQTPLTRGCCLPGSMSYLLPQTDPKSSPCSRSLPSPSPKWLLCYVSSRRVRQCILTELHWKHLEGTEWVFSCLLPSHSAQTDHGPRNRGVATCMSCRTRDGSQCPGFSPSTWQRSDLPGPGSCRHSATCYLGPGALSQSDTVGTDCHFQCFFFLSTEIPFQPEVFSSPGTKTCKCKVDLVVEKRPWPTSTLSPLPRGRHCRIWEAQLKAPDWPACVIPSSPSGPSMYPEFGPLQKTPEAVPKATFWVPFKSDQVWSRNGYRDLCS